MNKCLYLPLVLSLALWGGNVFASTEEHALPAEAKAVEAAYLLGPADQLSVHVVDLDDISDKPVRIDPNGYLELPLVGRIRAAGLTVEQLRGVLAGQAAKYIDSPQITINVLEYRSQPVSILGEVNNPGLHQLQGPTRLLEVISLAGGLKPDAGRKLTVTRLLKQGVLPLPGAHSDGTGQYSIASVQLNGLVDGSNPASNIEVRANDLISISRADLVFVGAAPRKARILRAVNGKASNRNEEPVDLAMVMAGKAPDIQLHPNDVLFVPDNVPASAMKRATEAAIQMATGVMIYRR